MKQYLIDTPYEQTDTITEDTILVNINLDREDIAKNFRKNTSGAYLAWACSPPEPKAKNKIKNLIFGLFLNGDTLNLNKTLLNTLALWMPNTNYSWPNDKDAFFLRFNYMEPYRFDASFLSPHNSKYIQFVTLAIKENGDTLKAVSQKVFCK